MIDAEDVLTCAAAIKQKPGLALGPAGAILTLDVVMELSTRLKATETLLRELFLGNLNDMTAANLPHEWSPSSPMGQADEYLKALPPKQPTKLNLVTA